MTLKQWLLNSKKAILAFVAPMVTVWVVQLIGPYNLGVSSTFVAGGVTFLLMILFGVLVYFAENIPPKLQDAIIDAVQDDNPQ